VGVRLYQRPRLLCSIQTQLAFCVFRSNGSRFSLGYSAASTLREQRTKLIASASALRSHRKLVDSTDWQARQHAICSRLLLLSKREESRQALWCDGISAYTHEGSKQLPRQMAERTSVATECAD
jgi:hypothetical protein